MSTFVRHPNFCSFYTGHLYVAWLWWPVRHMLASPISTVIKKKRVLKKSSETDTTAQSTGRDNRHRSLISLWKRPTSESPQWSIRSRLPLVKHTWLQSLPQTSEGKCYLCTLPYARLLVSPEGELSHISAPLVSMSSILVFKVAVQVTSLACLPLAVSRLVFLGPIGLWQSETQFLIGYHPQGTTQTTGWKISPVFVKEFYLLIMVLWPDGQASGLAHTSGAMELLSENTGRGCHLYVLPLTHCVSPVSL